MQPYLALIPALADPRLPQEYSKEQRMFVFQYAIVAIALGVGMLFFPSPEIATTDGWGYRLVIISMMVSVFCVLMRGIITRAKRTSPMVVLVAIPPMSAVMFALDLSTPLIDVTQWSGAVMIVTGLGMVFAFGEASSDSASTGKTETK